MTLNENNIGDEGARIFADAIKDDLWVKGICKRVIYSMPDVGEGDGSASHCSRTLDQQ